MVGQFFRAASAVSFSGTIFPRRKPPSAVIRILDFAVGDAVGEGGGAEAAENHGMYGADARAAEHGDGQLGDHGHVDGDAVTGLDAERLERIGEAADAFVQLRVGELDGGAVLGFPQERGLIGVFFEMAVEAVVGDVELAADEPFRVGRIPVEDLLGARTNGEAWLARPRILRGRLPRVRRVRGILRAN